MIIGKYKIIENDNFLHIQYRYTLSDLFGSFWYFLSIALGVLFLFVSIKHFKVINYSSWIFLITSLLFIFYGGIFILGGMFSLFNDAMLIDKNKRRIKIIDLFKTDYVDIALITGVSHEIISKYKPRQLNSILYFKLIDGSRKNCFVIRSLLISDVDNKIEKDLHFVSSQIRDCVIKAIK